MDNLYGPIKISDVWDRKYFNLVVSKIENEVVKSYYVRTLLAGQIIIL
jgi:REP element-mobilizing transposase RayT